MPRHGVPDIRDNWQKGAGAAARVEELHIEDVLRGVAAEIDPQLVVTPKPSYFHDLYYSYQRRKNPIVYERNDASGAVWYDAKRGRFMKNQATGGAENAKLTRNGIEPDLVLEHSGSARRVIVEIKRQNAAGNAHQRLFRYFPLLPELSRRCGGVESPFVACIYGPISRDPSYIAEIQTAFDVSGLPDHAHFFTTRAALVRWAQVIVFPLIMLS